MAKELINFKLQLSPEKIFTKRFSIVKKRGYNTDEVNSFLDIVTADYERIEKHFDQLQREIDSLKKENEMLKIRPTSQEKIKFDQLDPKLQKTLNNMLSAIKKLKDEHAHD